MVSALRFGGKEIPVDESFLNDTYMGTHLNVMYTECKPHKDENVLMRERTCYFLLDQPGYETLCSHVRENIRKIGPGFVLRDHLILSVVDAHLDCLDNILTKHVARRRSGYYLPNNVGKLWRTID